MGLFDFFKKKEQPAQQQQQSQAKESGKVRLAMPMFNNGETFDVQKVVDHLETYWKIRVSDINGENESAALTIQGEHVIIATMPMQIPWGDIQGTAQYAYNWPNAEKELEQHNAHCLVTLISSHNSEVVRMSILTKVLESILATTSSPGVYMGSQSLLLSKAQYLDSATALLENKLPIDLWVYIGLRKTPQGNCAYTYGLKSFDKLEMEVVDSPMELMALYDFLSNICAYVINSDVTFRHGETLGYTAEQKIKITRSKGTFVEGQTLKLEM